MKHTMMYPPLKFLIYVQIARYKKYYKLVYVFVT